jgi:hypothetical protein
MKHMFTPLAERSSLWLLFLLSVASTANVHATSSSSWSLAGFTPQILQWSQTAVKLARQVYHSPTGDAYSFFRFYHATRTPEQALIARSVYNVCFVAFRGTESSSTWDVLQNAVPGNRRVCSPVNNDTATNATLRKTCCSARLGYVKAYYSAPFREELEADLRTCTDYCIDNITTRQMPCPVVLTGHSQGGAIAAGASIALSPYQPYGITFGEPSSVDMPCSIVNTSRWFRYINTVTSDNSSKKNRPLVYDPVPFTPSMGGSQLFGHAIVLSDTGISYLSVDDAEEYYYVEASLRDASPAHPMYQRPNSTNPGYVQRLAYLWNRHKASSLWQFHDLMTGSLCHTDAECASQQCVYNSTTFPDSYRRRCKGITCTSDADCDTNECKDGVCVL